VRVALGADRAQVVTPIVSRALRLTAVGLGFGLSAAFAATRLLSALLFGVEPTDPTTFVWVTALLLVVVLVATYLPARRAMSIDPISALKAE
jgi:putative ABC transport system permease protein